MRNVPPGIQIMSERFRAACAEVGCVPLSPALTMDHQTTTEGPSPRKDYPLSRYGCEAKRGACYPGGPQWPPQIRENCQCVKVPQYQTERRGRVFKRVPRRRCQARYSALHPTLRPAFKVRRGVRHACAAMRRHAPPIRRGAPRDFRSALPQNGYGFMVPLRFEIEPTTDTCRFGVRLATRGSSLFIVGGCASRKIPRENPQNP